MEQEAAQSETSQARAEPVLALTTHPPGRFERWLALGVIFLTAATFITLTPYSSLPTARTPLLYPVYQSALIVFELITAILLYGRFAAGAPSSVLLLAGGFLFSSVMAVFHGLTFPGLFSSMGLLGAGEQTTAWLYVLWHVGFPAAVIGYALTANRPPRVPPADVSRSITAPIIRSAIAATALAALMMLVTTAGHEVLPPIVQGDADPLATAAVTGMTWLLALAAVPLLWRRGRLAVLDLWLLVVIAAWLCDVAQVAMQSSGRFSLGWYTGRIYGLPAAMFLLGALILEHSRIYARLARSFTDERRRHELVEQQTRELRTLNASLDDRVLARTSELEEAVAELQRSRGELREIALLATRAREQDRARLARELHDELNQSLIVLRGEVTGLRERLSRGPASDALTTLANMEQILDRTLAAAKRVATDLRPAVLDMLGLSAAAEWLLDQLAQRTGIECRLVIDPPELEIAEPYSTAIFRILQESLANVARHARASRVEVKLTVEGRIARLHVADDGIGFDPGSPRNADSYGLIGIRERVHLVSGRLMLESAPGCGTRIDVEIPLNGFNVDAHDSAVSH